jgi:hypothetical protein
MSSPRNQFLSGSRLMAVVAIARWLPMLLITGSRTANGNCRPTCHCTGPAPAALAGPLKANVRRHMRECNRCGATLFPGATDCARCGKLVDGTELTLTLDESERSGQDKRSGSAAWATWDRIHHGLRVGICALLSALWLPAATIYTFWMFPVGLVLSLCVGWLAYRALLPAFPFAIAVVLGKH